MLNIVRIPRWFDRHLHIRDGEMMKLVLPYTLYQRATGAVIMGNLAHPYETSTVEKAEEYLARILSVIPEGYNFLPRMTCYLTDDITPAEVVRGFTSGIWCAAKLYIAGQKGVGGTTNSGHGVKNLLGRYPVFEVMQKYRIPLLGHFEAVEKDVDEFDREVVSLERDLKPILSAFPELPVVFEHLTDGRAADFVAEAPYNIGATVTAHHLVLNRNDMFWGGLTPVHYCKPVPKREEHRLRVRKYVTSGHPRFGAGTDSAPHDENAKARCSGCAAGIFTAPCAVEIYTTAFDEDGGLKYLGNFMSRNLLDKYGMDVSREMMTIERLPTVVSPSVGAVPVFYGGGIIPWRITS